MMDFIQENDRSPGVGTIVVAFITVLSGQFGLDRIGLDLPLLRDDVRPLLFVCLAIMVIADHVRLGHIPPRRAANPRADAVLMVLLFFSYQVVSSAWAPERAQIGSRIEDILYLAILVIVYATFARWNVRRTVYVSAVCSYLAGLTYFSIAALGFGHDPSGRWAALGGGPNVFVRVMAVGVIAAVFLYLHNHHPSFLIGVPLFGMGMFMSGSRGGVIAASLTVILVIILAARRIRLRLAVRGVLILAPTAVAIWHFLGAAVSSFVYERYAIASLNDRYASGRDVIFSEAWDMFTSRPLFGHGLDGFYGTTGYRSGHPYPHDLPLSIAAEGGIVGLVLLALAVIACTKSGIAHIRFPPTQFCLAVACFIAIASMFSGGYYDARQLWIYLAVAACAEPVYRQAPEPVTS